MIDAFDYFCYPTALFTLAISQSDLLMFPIGCLHLHVPSGLQYHHSIAITNI